MNDKTDQTESADAKRDYSKTLFLPKTDFPLREEQKKKEPEIIAQWDRLGLYRRLRDAAAGRTKYVLHDGPPYANGHLHIGHALNKILKDVVTRSFQMQGYDSNYVPGWDCHGLPIEWKIEEQYRAKGKNKNDVAINEFRQECREFAQHWIGVQSDEFRRLGVEGDFQTPYTTMAFHSEAAIANELMKFAKTGQLYRGSKPVMWSVVEHTALAEAEVEYQDYQSDTIWVTFPVVEAGGTDDAAVADLLDSSVVIWTTTPWTMPGNRAISYSARIPYGLYEVTEAPADNWAVPGDKLILADALADDVFKQARVEAYRRIRAVTADEIAGLTCAHPLRDAGLGGYQFDVPLLEGDHVTEEAGTGFVHTAPGHGMEDFEIWMARRNDIELAGIETAIPYTVDGEGYFTADAPGFMGVQVLTHKGEKGKANQTVIDALVAAGRLVARGRLKHTYPHSWRSKKPVIFRNTPQWFVHMDKNIGSGNDDRLRNRALRAIEATRFVPEAGQRRLYSMIETRPDWVLSRQRAWGVPITVFVHNETAETIPNESFDKSDELSARIVRAFEEEGADAWFVDEAKQRFLTGLVDNPDDWEQVTDILDVWFDSGSTHAYVMETRNDLIVDRVVDGGNDRVIYLEGSDQHRGWFHSSLLESSGTRGRAPFDVVITHGFTMDEEGRKMSKSLGNQTFPQDIIKQYGADILRLWVMSCDYAEDQRIGPEILKTNVDAYRKLRNTLRWMLGSLAHFEGDAVDVADMPELERLMLHRLVELDGQVKQGYDAFDYKRIFSALFNFMTIDLSAFYFDVRKDVLYCDPYSSMRRKAALSVIDRLFDCLVKWLAPMLPFTCEETWLSRHPGEDGSVHLEQFSDVPASWRDDALAEKWSKIRAVRRVVTGALEIERRDKRIGSSLEAAPKVYISDAGYTVALEGADLAEISITSDITIVQGEGPHDAFRLDDTSGVSVVPERAEGRKCARSWKVSSDVGSDPEWPDLSPRDAKAMREFEKRGASVA